MRRCVGQVRARVGAVTGFYILVPVETKQQKYFVDHVVDITDK